MAGTRAARAAALVAAVVTAGASFGATAQAATSKGRPAAPSCDHQRATLVSRGGAVRGTARRDVVVATGRAVRVDAGAGNDVVCGSRFADVLQGGAGNDRLFGGPGDDALYAGAGNDVLDGGAGNDRLYGGPGSDVLAGGAGNDLVAAYVAPKPAKPVKKTTQKPVRRVGTRHLDAVVRGGGLQRLLGGAGNDTLVCGTGICSVDGGTGTNTAVTGTGPAVFTHISVLVLTPAHGTFRAPVGTKVVSSSGALLGYVGPTGSGVVPTPPGTPVTGGTPTPTPGPTSGPVVTAFTVSGRVLDEHGKPDLAAGPGLYRVGDASFFRLGNPDAQGRYAFSGLAAGTYDVIADQGQGYQQDVARVVVSNADVTVRDLVVRRVPATGTYAVSGRVLAEGVPDPDALAVLVGGSTQPLTSTADQGGHYRFTGVEPGTYTVEVSDSGYDTASASVVVTDHDVVVPDLTIQRRGGAAEEGAVTGTVTDDEGIPLAGIRVDACVEPNLVEEPELGEVEEFCSYVEPAVTDEEGHYALEGVPAGEVSVFVNGQFDLSTPSEELVAEPGEFDPSYSDDAGSVLVSEGDVATHDVHLRPAGTISGQVAEPQGYGEAFVVVVDDQGLPHFGLSEQGAFLLQGLATGDYQLQGFAFDDAADTSAFGQVAAHAEAGADTPLDGPLVLTPDSPTP